MNKKETVAIYADFSDVTVSTAVSRELIARHITDKSIKLRDESVYGRILLKYLLSVRYGVTDFTIGTDEKGKPYLLDSDLHFNLSHSGKKVFCAVSHDSVGCDVEHIRTYNPRVAERFYTSDEYTLLGLSNKRQEHFTKLWTLKESVLKQKGVGISGGLSHYGFSEYMGCESFSAYGLFFRSFAMGDYYYGICSQTENISVFESDIKDIIKNLV